VHQPIEAWIHASPTKDKLGVSCAYYMSVILSLIVEGRGQSFEWEQRILIKPTELHQRICAFIGSKGMMEESESIAPFSLP
jgi:fructose-1,6-bisphosphatase